MNQIVLYIDEDAMDNDLVSALRSRGVDVSSALDADMIEVPDSEHLAFAAAQGRVLCSFNVADFYSLHAQWLQEGRSHAGMILAPQQRFSVGEQLRRLLRLRAALSASDLLDQVEFLGNWG